MKKWEKWLQENVMGYELDRSIAGDTIIFIPASRFLNGERQAKKAIQHFKKMAKNITYAGDFHYLRIDLEGVE